MAEKHIPTPAPIVKIQLLRDTGASLTFRVVTRRAALDASSKLAELNPTSARILPFVRRKHKKAKSND